MFVEHAHYATLHYAASICREVAMS